MRALAIIFLCLLGGYLTFLGVLTLIAGTLGKFVLGLVSIVLGMITFAFVTRLARKDREADSSRSQP